MNGEQIAWVSGASGDIGSAIVRQLASRGVKVGALYHSRQDRVNVLENEFADVKSFQIEVTSRSSVEQVYQQITELWGEPSLLIHAAGHAHSNMFQDDTDTVYQQMMDVHVKGAFYLIQTNLPAMIRRKSGRIVLLSSVWGEKGGACEVLYSMAKGALNSLTKALAKEVAPSGITVNAVAPGAVNGQMVKRQLSPEDMEELAQEIPVGRLAEPAEVAYLVDYLCQPQASYVTGQIMNINGGWHV